MLENCIEQTVYPVAIIGSGPGGYTAGLYASRANLNPILFTGLQKGGQLMITTEVENYPGFPEGILGPDLMDLFEKQAARFGLEIVHEFIDKVDFSQRPFTLYTHDKIYKAHTVIVATGAEAKWLGLESEKTFGGYGVSACATCDGFFFRDKEVIVVGGGDSAMEEALFLTRFCKKVYIVHRRNELRASKIMQQRALCHPKIEMLWNTLLEEILGELAPVKKVTSVRLRNTQEDRAWVMPIEGVFLAIGHTPNTQVFKGILDLDEMGYLKLQDRSSRTNIAGVFAAGDVADSVYRQAVSAAGMGCIAAIDAERFLESEADFGTASVTSPEEVF